MLCNPADLRVRGGEQNVDIVFFRGFLCGDGKVQHIVPVDIVFYSDFKKGSPNFCFHPNTFLIVLATRIIRR